MRKQQDKRRPRVKVKCVADRHAEVGERIIEFTDPVTKTADSFR